MRVELRPEPDEGELRAIAEALARLLSAQAGLHPAYASRWRRAGLEEPSGYAPAPPRSSRGAARA